MNKCFFFQYLTTACVWYCLLGSTSTTAQVLPDATLPNNSNITQLGNTITISGGTQTGSNLFHSFDVFSIPTASTVYFNNASDIRNIFSRVTGSSISIIDGLLRANGTANLFLINPKGIIFGSNAKLDIGGSFVGSTANSIKFIDDIEFSATEPQLKPLLTVSVPLGLKFGSNPEEIRVQGTGHNLKVAGFLPVKRSTLQGLQVKSGNTLALLGGDIVLEGGNLIAEGGRIELGSVESGLVSFTPSTNDWNFNYKNIPKFRDISLSQKASLDTSVTSGINGSIQLKGQNISLTNGSIVLNQNQSSLPSGSLKIDASELLAIEGISSEGNSSFIRTETVGSGKGADVVVSTRQLIVREGGNISSRTFSTDQGGSIIVDAPNFTILDGFSPTNPLISSSISTNTLGFGNAGDLVVSTGRLFAQNGGTVISLSRGSGSGANVTVNATNSIELTNSEELINSDSVYPSSSLAATAFNAGNAGNLTLNTPRVLAGKGAVINSSTVGEGNAGSVTINAFESIEVSGVISSAAVRANEYTQKLFASPPVPSGNSGEVKINTPRLSVVEGGVISARNEGQNNAAGTIRIKAETINLSNTGNLTSATTSGEGGSIFIQSNNIQLLNGSNITTDATGGTGNGGDITIDTNLLSAFNNSSITAKAVEGRGGNIKIGTQGLFRSPDSSINASSQKGINGTIQFNGTIINPSNGLIELPVQVIDDTKLIAQSCPAETDPNSSSFVVTGRGGLPEDPYQPLSNSTVWEDFRPVKTSRSTQQSRTKVSTPEAENSVQDQSPPVALEEANSWSFNPKGEIMLVASVPSNTVNVPWLNNLRCNDP